jgi:hypothetical protein
MTLDGSVATTATVSVSDSFDDNPAPSNSVKSRKRRAKGEHSDDAIAMQAAQSLKCIQSYMTAKLEQKSVKMDEDDEYCRVIAVDLKKIRNAKIKRGLKKKLNDLIFQALEDDDTGSMQQAAGEQSFVLPNGEVLSIVNVYPEL